MAPVLKHKIGGWSVWDLLVAIAALLVLASMVLPLMSRATARAPRIACVNNLKQIGTAYRVWSGDNQDRLPCMARVSEGGWLELLDHTNSGKWCWTNYVIMRQELAESPQVLVCPCDKRKTVTNISSIKDNSPISYFVGVNATDTYPQSFLGGDRNLGPGVTPKDDYGYSLADNLGNNVIVSTNWKRTPLTWTLKTHSAGSTNGGGNLLLGDGSVQQTSSSRLRIDYQPNAGVPVKPPDSPGWMGTQDSFRLIFP